MEKIITNNIAGAGAATCAATLPQKTYVDGHTLIAWLWDTFNIKADRSKLVDLRKQGMPKRQFSPRCIRYNLEAVATWIEREFQSESVEVLKELAIRELSLRGGRTRTVKHV